MRGLYATSRDKLSALETVLEECTKFKQKFKSVSALAEYCALRLNDKYEAVSTKDERRSKNHLAVLGNVGKAMHYRSLLRENSSYRSLLDHWMYTNSGKQFSFEQARIRELEVKLLRLGNEYNTVKKLYAEKLESVALLEDKNTSANSLDDAFAIVEALLDRFSLDVVLEDGAIKERSVVRTIYVSARLMKPYIDWLGSEL